MGKPPSRFKGFSGIFSWRWLTGASGWEATGFAGAQRRGGRLA